jgi:hypothetical protein
MLKSSMKLKTIQTFMGRSDGGGSSTIKASGFGLCVGGTLSEGNVTAAVMTQVQK